MYGNDCKYNGRRVLTMNFLQSIKAWVGICTENACKMNIYIMKACTVDVCTMNGCTVNACTIYVYI